MLPSISRHFKTVFVCLVIHAVPHFLENISFTFTSLEIVTITTFVDLKSKQLRNRTESKLKRTKPEMTNPHLVVVVEVVLMILVMVLLVFLWHSISPASSSQFANNYRIKCTQLNAKVRSPNLRLMNLLTNSFSETVVSWVGSQELHEGLQQKLHNNVRGAWFKTKG